MRKSNEPPAAAAVPGDERRFQDFVGFFGIRRKTAALKSWQGPAASRVNPTLSALARLRLTPTAPSVASPHVGRRAAPDRSFATHGQGGSLSSQQPIVDFGQLVIGG